MQFLLYTYPKITFIINALKHLSKKCVVMKLITIHFHVCFKLKKVLLKCFLVLLKLITKEYLLENFSQNTIRWSLLDFFQKYFHVISKHDIFDWEMGALQAAL